MKPKILVVEDDRDTLEATRALLQDRCKVLTAGPENPVADAVRLWKQHPDISLALVDLRMPDERGKVSDDTGFELIERLKQDRSWVRFLVHSGYGNSQNRERAAGLSVDDFIIKDTSAEEFLERIETAFRQVRPRPESEVGGEELAGQFRRPGEMIQHLELQRKHGGQVVAVRVIPGREPEVWGAGADHGSALDMAREKARQAGLPMPTDLLFVVVPLLMAERGGDYEWLLHDRNVQEKFGGLVVALRERNILGAGNDRSEALAAARRTRDCPAEEQLQFVLVPYVLPHTPGD